MKAKIELNEADIIFLIKQEYGADKVQLKYNPDEDRYGNPTKGSFSAELTINQYASLGTFLNTYRSDK